MFEALKQQLMPDATLSGLIQSHEGDIYIAQLIAHDGKVISQNKDHFNSLINARNWLEQKGAQTISLQPSTAYFEMINN